MAKSRKRPVPGQKATPDERRAAKERREQKRKRQLESDVEAAKKRSKRTRVKTTPASGTRAIAASLPSKAGGKAARAIAKRKREMKKRTR